MPSVIHRRRKGFRELLMIYYPEKKSASEMASKACKSCNTVKTITEFTPGKAICKSCRNRREVANRKMLAEPAVPVTTDKEVEDSRKKAKLLDPLEIRIRKMLTIFVEELSTDDALDKLMDSLQAAFAMTANIRNGVIPLSFAISVSPAVHVYLTTIFEDDGTFRDAKYHLRSSDAAEFEQYFGVKVSDIDSNEIEELEHITSFVRVVYQILIDEYLAAHNSKFSSKQVPKIEMPAVSFDAVNDQVVVLKNPLELTIAQFCEALRQLENSDYLNFKMYQQHGIYKKFKEKANLFVID